MTKNGFTLAEVLITLGVIGIVSALTIPTLIQNYQEKSWDTAADLFEKKINESLRVMNTQQNLSGHKNTEDFVTELSKNMKLNKTCNNEDLKSCFVNTFTKTIVNLDTLKEDAIISIQTNTLKNAKDVDLEEWGNNTNGIMFANGTTGILIYNKKCKADPYNNNFNATGCVSILYDTNGFGGPNEFGKDIRQYGNINTSKFSFRLNGRDFTSSFYPQSVDLTECKRIVSSGEYGTIPYGCYDGTAQNYWMGGVKQCGNIKNLPTIDDLKKIAEILYPELEIKTTGQKAESNCNNGTNCIDPEALKTIKKALNIEEDAFYIFTNTEDSTPRAVLRYFSPNQTYQLNQSATLNKGWNNVRVMCAN